MKRFLVVSMVFALILAGSVTAFASGIQIDGLYLFGKSGMTVGSEDSVKTENGHGFVANLEAELYPNVIVEGRYFSHSAKNAEVGAAADADPETTITQSTIAGGAKYRLFTENGLNVYVGAGYANYNYEDKTEKVEDANLKLAGSGIYGKVGVSFDVSKEISVYGDVAYAPISKKFERTNSEGATVKDLKGTILSGRGGLVYNINEMLGVQAGITLNQTSVGEGETANKASATVYGAGLVVRF